MSRRLVTAAALALCATALTGCGVGLSPQTYAETSSRAFHNTTTGDLDLRNFAIQPPLTGDVIKTTGIAQLTGTIVNTGSSDDALIGVTSADADMAVLSDGTSTVTSIPIPAQGDSGTAWSAQITGLKSDLLVNTYLSVTLQFQKSGQITVMVPVLSGDQAVPERSPDQNPYKPTD